MNKENLRKITGLRHELHAHPELPTKEVWTKSRLMDFLKTNTKLEIVDKGAWFYAFYNAGDGKRTIAFRADFDAIAVDDGIDQPYNSKFPGVSHKCGHDGHSATLCGFAMEVDQNGAECNIYFVFQHAEETAEGAIVCAPLMKEKGIEEIFCYHNMSNYPEKSIVVREGTIWCASKGMIIKMTGTPTHASMPELGRNPAFAIASIVSAIPDLILPEKYKGLVLCTVIQINLGDRAFGVSASAGELLLTIRGQYEAEMNSLQEALEKMTKAEAEKYGLDYSFEFCDVFPETANYKESVEKVRKAAKKLELELVEIEKPIRTSEDFGYFLKETKGAVFFVGNGKDYPSIHTAEYDFPDKIIESAVEMFKELSGCS